MEIGIMSMMQLYGISVEDHTIPSVTLSNAKPDWWGTKFPWPAYGPDLNPMCSSIPAESRYYLQPPLMLGLLVIELLCFITTVQLKIRVIMV